MPEGFIVLWVVWAALSAGTWLFYMRNRDAALKRRVLRVQMPLVAIAFLAIVVVMLWPHLEVLVIMVPAVALITWLNLRNTKFCDACGATLINQNWLSGPRHCSRCGAPLTPDARPPGPADGG
jgi:hypothetical protein